MYETKIFDVTNTLRQGPIRHASIEEAKEWLAKHIGKQRPFGWGINERWEKEQDVTPAQIPYALESKQEVDESGTIVNWYKMPANYRVVVEDISNSAQFKKEQMGIELSKEVSLENKVEALWQWKVNNDISLLNSYKKKIDEIKAKWA